MNKKRTWELHFLGRAVVFIETEQGRIAYLAVLSFQVDATGTLISTDTLLQIDPEWATIEQVFEDLERVQFPPPFEAMRQTLLAHRSQFVLFADLSLTPLRAQVYGWVEDMTQLNEMIARYRATQIGANSPIGQAIAEQLRRPS